MSIRVHEVSQGKHHWALSDRLCPTCDSMKNYPCIDKDSRQYMPVHSVHISRVRANGHNAR